MKTLDKNMLYISALNLSGSCNKFVIQTANNWRAPWKNRTSRYIFFPPITQWCSISDVLFTGGRRVSEFSVL